MPAASDAGSGAHQQPAAVGEGDRQPLDRGRDDRYAERECGDRALRPRLLATGHHVHVGADDVPRGLLAPAGQLHLLPQTEVVDQPADLAVHRTVADQVGDRRLVHQGERAQQQVRALVLAQPAGERQARADETGSRRGVYGDGRPAGYQPGRVDAEVADVRMRSGAVDEERVHPSGGIRCGAAVVAQRPAQRVVLAGDQRHAGRHRAARGPPGAEHVGVHEVGATHMSGEPTGEQRVRGPLPRRVRDVVVTRAAPRPRSRSGGPARCPAGWRRPANRRVRDPERGLGAGQPQHRELGATWLEDTEDPDDSHNHTVVAAGNRTMNTTPTPR